MSQYNRVTVLEAQVKRLQEKLTENSSSQVRLNHLRGVQDREKEEWKESERLLQKQLAKARQECLKLKRENQGSRNGTRGGSEEAPPTSVLHRSFSSQSLPTHVSTRDMAQASPTPSLHSYPLHAQMKPTLASYAGPPLGNNLIDHSHLSASSSSISSIRSTNSALNHAHRSRDQGTHTSQHKLTSNSHHLKSHVPFSSTPRYPSSLYRGDTLGLEKPWSRYGTYDHTSLTKPHPTSGGVDDKNTGTVSTGTPPDVELQRSKLKIKQLQKEVSLLDHHLCDKTHSAQGHVEELVLLRTELAQEKASLAIVRQELQDHAAREVGVARALHTRKVKELEAELKRKNMERGRVDVQLQELRTKLKGSETECQRRQEYVARLENEAAEEREAHSRAVRQLHGDVESGCMHIAKLEGALQHCKVELEGHMTRVEEDSTQHATQMWQMRRQVERLSEELKQKENELTRKLKHGSHLQQEIESVRAEFKQAHTSWQRVKKELKEQLLQSEVAKESLLKQLALASQNLTLHSVQVEGQREEVRGELDKCRKEVERLERVVRREIAERRGMEAEVEKWKSEMERVDKKSVDAQNKREEAERRWREERAGKEACEQEGEELRKEVGRLSEELRVCQHQLQGEIEAKAEKEKNVEETLAHLQQELAKRAQQVLEMDRLLQSHQAETTARRLQLERALSQRQGELRNRTQEVEELTSRVSERQSTISEVRGQLGQAKEDQRNLFSGSQAQLLAQDSKVSGLERKLKEVEAVVAKVSKEAELLREKVREVEGREREARLTSEQCQEKIKVLTKENDTLHARHLAEVQRLQEMHASQLTSREQQANTHRFQLQQLAHQDKARQEELSRCRTQVASLSAELSAEQRVSEESREQVATARTQASKHKTQVASLQGTVGMMQEMLERQTMGLRDTPTTMGLGTMPMRRLDNGVPGTSTSLHGSENGLGLPNHLKTSLWPMGNAPTSKPSLHTTPTGPLTPPTQNSSPVTPPTSQRGGIISI